MSSQATRAPTEVVYENQADAPATIHGLMGVLSPHGGFQLMLYSEHLRPKPEGKFNSDVRTRTVDKQFEVDIAIEESNLEPPSFQIVRRIEANLFLTLPLLKVISKWVEGAINELESKTKK